MNFEQPKSGDDGNSTKPKIDMISFERRQRQFLNELAMKRVQVEDLKKELDTANLKIHEVSRALDSAKNTVDDQQYNLSLALKNVRFLEDKLQTKRDSMMKTRLQQESAVTERENLRELLQKAELQNFTLVQQLNELKAQHTCDVAYQKELMNKDGEIRTKIAKLAEAVQKFHVNANEMDQLGKKVQTWEEMQTTVDFYQQELQKYKENYKKLENKFIVANAAVENFQKLATDNEDRFHTDQGMDMIISQWLKARIWFTDYTKTQQEVIENLTKTLKTEKEMNMKVCIRETELEAQNAGLQKENTELKKMLSEFTKEHQDIAVQTEVVGFASNAASLIKAEVVEIIDDN